MAISAIVTDIEGTTTSLSFVKDILFPYAYDRMEAFLLRYHERADVAAQIREVEKIAGQEMNPGKTIALLKQWIEEDKKIAPLKTLQGMMWEEGYKNGDFKGHLYEDAAEVLKRWHHQNIALYVYSSGSVQAQKLLFAHTEWGDMTQLFKGYFDTAVGGKKEPVSYQHILASIDKPAAEVLFLSDVTEELDAAEQAGMCTLQVVRDEPVAGSTHPYVSDFYAIKPEHY